MCRRVPGAHIHRGHRVDQRVMRVLLGHSGDPFESAQYNAFCCKAVPPLRLATQRNALQHTASTWPPPPQDLS